MPKRLLVKAWFIALPTLAALNLALYYSYHSRSFADTLVRIAFQGVAVTFVLYVMKDPYFSRKTDISRPKTYGAADCAKASTVNSYRKLLTRLCSLGKTAEK